MTTLTAPILELPAGQLAVADVRDFLRSAIEWLPIGMLVANGEGMIAVVNREVERVFAYGEGELIGQSIGLLVPDVALPGDRAPGGDVTAQPQPRAIGAGREMFGRRRDGSEVPVEVKLTPIRLKGSALLLASVIDLTERRRAQLALEERLTFERVVGELGAAFVNLRPEDVERALQDALGRMVRTLGLDRGALFEVEESGDFVHTHQATRLGCSPALPRISAQRDFPWHLSRIRSGALVSFATVDDVPDATDRESLRRLGTKSAVTLPLSVAGQTWGALSFSTVRKPRSWPPDVINRLRVVALIFANALARRVTDRQLRRTVDAMTALRDRLRDENHHLRDELQRLAGTQAVIGHSPAIRRMLEQVRQAATTDVPVLLVGEPGTGKALLAARIHDLSGRRERAMVRVNCAATTALIDGLATESTVFFDEITDLSLEGQESLMRILQDGQVQLPDHAGPVNVDVRIIAATHKDLKRCVEEGTFREDLYFCLNTFPIRVPPLRERREDIPMLLWRFVDEFSVAYRRPIDALDQVSMRALQSYSWPGNARELRHVVEQAMMESTARRLHIPLPSTGAVTKDRKTRSTSSRRV